MKSPLSPEVRNLLIGFDLIEKALGLAKPPPPPPPTDHDEADDDMPMRCRSCGKPDPAGFCDACASQ